MCQYIPNRFRQPIPLWSDDDNELFSSRDIARVHHSLAEYSPTPAVSLPGLAQFLGVNSVVVKDESYRFGLKAFKALGASYAIYRWVAEKHRLRNATVPTPAELFAGKALPDTHDVTFCTATDGNHGRGVAWIARKLGRPARIYMPADSAPSRVDAIRDLGAHVTIIDGSYDLAVQQCARDASINGWQIISDTSWTGYSDIPRWIMAAYTTIFREADAQMDNIRPDLVIVQGGVGALAASAAWYYNRGGQPARPQLVCVEPDNADCLAQSAASEDGVPVTVASNDSTIMAGLNCGTPSLVAWPLIRSGFDGFIVINDDWCRKAMRTYYSPSPGDARIISGESGAASLAALLAICELPSLDRARDMLRLTDQTTVFMINTEGDTGPASFQSIVSHRQ